MTNKVNKSFPDFLIIGAGKSGTTSLYHYLGQHPDIFLPKIKEPNFFAYEMHKEDDFEDESTKEHFMLSITSLKEYTELFEKAKPGQIIGENSNTYLYMPHALERIKYYIPNCKIIAILRQPAERIFSRYTHLERINQVPSNFFSDIFDRNSIWWKRPDLIMEGFYYRHLNKYYKNFHSDDIKVLLFDELINDPGKVLKDITDFLGADSSFKFQVNTQFNVSGRIKSKLFNKLIGHNSILISGLQTIVPVLYENIKMNSSFRSVVEKLRSKNIERLHLSEELKQRITNEIYKEDIKSLEKLVKINLKHWY